MKYKEGPLLMYRYLQGLVFFRVWGRARMVELFQFNNVASAEKNWRFQNGSNQPSLNWLGWIDDGLMN